MGDNHSFGSVTFQPADRDLWDSNPSENVVIFKMSKREIYTNIASKR